MIAEVELTDPGEGLPQQLRTRLLLPAYGVSEAARYSHIDPNTVRAWYYGTGRTIGPVFPIKERSKPLSYLQLVEVAVASAFRSLGVSLKKIQTARSYLAQMFNFEFPFAQIRLKTEGQYIIFDYTRIEPDDELNRLVLADQGGQIGWEPAIGDKFMEFDYEYQLALRWHPAGRHSPVLIDPRIGFGAPSVHGIATWAIKGRRVAGMSIKEIADDYALDEALVEAALDFEGMKN